MIKSLSQAVATFPDKRRGRNLKYQFAEAALGAFSAFFTQSPSFLAHQRMMQEAQGTSNASSLFGLIQIPSDNHIRDLLDEVPPDKVFPVFDNCFNLLLKEGYLEQFRQESGDLLIALDGTEYFSSESIHCHNCSTKEHKKGVITYSHSMITPVIVSPDKSNIIPLAPEYITPQDGHLKQDCENMAGKRWLKARGSKLLSKLRLADLSLGITILGDDLYSRQPICIELLKAGFNFILVCKEESHPYLYQWVKDLETGEDKDQKHQLITKRWTGKFHEVTTYHFANNIPLKEGKEALRVSWCQVTVTREETGKQLYHNGFVVSRTISQENIVEVILGGRARWKVENENNNTLKTKGYHLEHNFGHGKKYLATLLAAFTLISFLFHTVMDLTDTLYQSLRARLGSRENFFNGIKQLTTFMYFRGWEHMFNFMIEGLKRRHLAPG